MFFDHPGDSSQQKLHTYATQFLDGQLPEFVDAKEAGDDSVVESRSFADPVSRKFPLHTKSATYLSCLYFNSQRAADESWSSCFNIEKTAERLSNAAKFWDITSETNALIDAIHEKSASAERELTDDDFALMVNYGSEAVKRFPVVNKTSAVKAAEDLYRDRVQYPYAWRRKAATNILKKAKDLDAVLPNNALNYLFKASGLFPADSESIAADLYKRSLVFPLDMRPAFRKAADAVNNTGNDLFRLCELLDTADRRHKKCALYRDGMPMPEEILFTGVPEKQAAAVDETITLTTGTEYHLDDIKSAGLEPFALLPDYIEDIAANDKGDLDLEKVAEILPTMPRDDAQRLDKGLHAVGVVPVTEKAAKHERVGGNNFISGMTDIARKRGGKVSDNQRTVFQLTHEQGVHSGTRDTTL